MVLKVLKIEHVFSPSIVKSVPNTLYPTDCAESHTIKISAGPPQEMARYLQANGTERRSEVGLFLIRCRSACLKEGPQSVRRVR
jgi:hypothetical protein